MSLQPSASRMTLRDIKTLHKKQEKIVCLTAYTAPVAKMMDDHVDLILVGDSLGMVIYGFDSTVPVTMDMMVAHGQAVMRGAKRAFVTVDMPFGSYQESTEQACRNAARIMKETGCGAVKLEGGAEMAETTAFLTQRGIAVMGHIGLKPQSVNATGGYRMMGRARDEGESIIADARAIEKAGAFAIVLECVDEDLAQRVVGSVDIPVIGIGASAACAGQILVVDDIVGMNTGHIPKFVKQYADLQNYIQKSVISYAEEVRNGSFPGQDHVYKSKTVSLVSPVKTNG